MLFTSVGSPNLVWWPFFVYKPDGLEELLNQEALKLKHTTAEGQGDSLAISCLLSRTKVTETVRCCRRVMENLALCHAHHFHLPSSSGSSARICQSHCSSKAYNGLQYHVIHGNSIHSKPTKHEFWHEWGTSWQASFDCRWGVCFPSSSSPRPRSSHRVGPTLDTTWHHHSGVQRITAVLWSWKTRSQDTHLLCNGDIPPLCHSLVPRKPWKNREKSLLSYDANMFEANNMWWNTRNSMI